MKKPSSALATLSLAVVLLLSFASLARAVTLEQTISRENPIYNNSNAEVTIGRDGMVYLNSSAGSSGYALRMSREGKDKTGINVGPMVGNVAANANGVLATAVVHFASAVNLYDRDFNKFATVDEFVSWTPEFGEASGYGDPARVEVGASGDFYANDQFKDFVLRLSPAGQAIKKYIMPRDGTGINSIVWDFRLNEKAELFYTRSRLTNQIRAIGFDGKEKWKAPIETSGGFDVDEHGTLWAASPRSDVIQKIDADGKPAGSVTLTGDIAGEGDWKSALQKFPITSMRVWGNEIFVKRQHPTEAFLRFDATSGVLKQAVATDFETLKVDYPGEIWTAGQSVDFSIAHSDPILHAKPQWRVWATGLSTPDYKEWKIVGGKLQVPADAVGIYQIKVTPEVQPILRGTASEYEVQSWIEVRQPNSKGTANVFTPDNRAYFARGENVPFAVLLRGAKELEGKSLPVVVQLRDEKSARVLAELKTNLQLSQSSQFSIAPSLTNALVPGRYVLSASTPGLTAIEQPLVIGDAGLKSSFLNVMYGDYEQPGFYPNSTNGTTTDLATSYVDRLRKLGVNLVVERLGHNTGAISDNRLRSEMETLRARLAADPLAVAPDKVLLAPPLMQTMAALGANGISQMSILLYMDAALPIGSAAFADGRKFPKLFEDITTVTNGLKPYPAFRGWSWAANWWVWDAESVYTSPEEKAAYLAALKKAKETGEWNPVLGQVGDRRFSFAVDAEKQFRTLLNQLAPGRVSAATGPYRNISTYPPVSYAGADEVDLQYQAEQVQPPNTIWHNVDYQKRPGKQAWGHPELWNDDGTGGQVLPGLFGMAMRGADGVGLSGHIPWSKDFPEDVRSAYFGTTSVWRAALKLFNHYGPWLQTFEPNDHVAIVVSGRMAKIDDWKGVGGEYFSRLFEAYQSCLYAHRPASYVFAEDLKPTTLQNYSAVIVAGQTVEFEPALLAALQNAKAKGVAVFADGTSRESLVKEFTPLGVAFDNVANDPSVWQDDAAQWRFADYFVTDATVVAKALSKVAVPAETSATQVLLTERRAENARYLWVVNNTVPEREAGELWRVARAITTREPIQPTIKFIAPTNAIYDVFAMKQVALQNGALTADLRTLPARLYAILPATIDRIALRGPSTLTTGQNFKWWLQMRDAADKPIAASVPVRLRLLSGGAVIEERFISAAGAGTGGSMTLPLGASTPILEATELLSGKASRLALKSTPEPLPVALDKPRASAEAPANASGEKFAATLQASDEDFGVHARDMVVSSDGGTAVISAMNWGDNVYGLDVQTGKLKWSNRFGEHFTYAPQRLSNGFAVEGFDFKTPEGYHLYLAGDDGKPTRRFALNGLPNGGINWAFTGMRLDRANNFAVALDGSWVASVGDFGPAVWDKSGKLLWSQDWRAQRRVATLTALGTSTLVVGEGITATAYNAQSGKQQWQLKLASSGEIFEGKASRDGSTLALRSDTDNGRVFIVRAGKAVTNFLTKAEDMALSDDGSTLALVTDNLLKVYDVGGGLKWSYAGDDRLHFPRIAPDGKRIVVSSELGTVAVLGMNGTVLHESDEESLAAPAWLESGDLLLATWNGEVSRLDAKYKRLWRSHLQLPNRARPDASTPTSRMTNWINADAQPAPLAPNLLADTKAVISMKLNGRAVELKNKVELLTDGKADAPALPWVPWNNLSIAQTGFPGQMEILFDTFRTQIRLTGITFIEDPKHPESWLRDANLEYWDVAKAQWVFGASLLSDSATHTHTFAKPIESARFRLVKPSADGVWPVGNIRLGEVVFHGEQLGASHPDVIAKRPRAVLFDEGEDLLTAMLNVTPNLDNAFSGGRSLQVEGGRSGVPQWTPPFGHALPNWNFAIRENPQPGEYRWLQFAWKALSPQTTGMSLLIGNPFPGGGVNLVAGDYKLDQGVIVEKKVADAPPTQWKTVRVDMWELLKKPMDIQCLILGANGGPAAFDQIVLGRTEADLPPQK